MQFTPVWKGGKIEDEIIIFVEKDGEISANLAFGQPKSVKICDRNGNQLVEGKDFEVQGNKVVLLNKSYFYFTDEWLRNENVPDTIPSENERYHIEGCLLVSPNYLYGKQYCASYEGEALDMPNIFPERLQLTRAHDLLSNKKHLKIALFGDSISNAANSSWNMGFGGEHWITPAIAKIEESYGATIDFLNISRSGYGVGWGIDEGVHKLKDEGVDLTVIAFGMNDGFLTKEAFLENMQKLINLAKEYNPQMEFILVATPIPNPACKQVYGSQWEHFSVLKTLEGDGVTVLDMTTPFTYLLTKKRYVEIGGNNLNHPNDFTYRFYTDAFIELFRRLKVKNETRMHWDEYTVAPEWERVHFTALPENIEGGYIKTQVNGKEKKTFAFIAKPKTVKEKLPAVVLVHGAGGNAFWEWAQAYAEQGFVAISIDIDCTHFTDDDLTQRKPNDFVGPRLIGGFPHIGKDAKDSWIYYSVAQIASSASLLAAMDEVDENRIALVGISWGGVASLIALGEDKRFKTGAIIYSSGFITEDHLGMQTGLFTDENNKEFYDTRFDPRNYVIGSKTPVLMNAGLNDGAFSPFSRKRTYDLFDEQPSLAIIPDLYHDNVSNFHNKNVAAYLSDKFKGTKLRRQLVAQLKDEQLHLTTDAQVTRAELLSSDGEGDPHKLVWASQPIVFENGKACVARPKEKYSMAIIYYGDGLYTTTDIFER